MARFLKKVTTKIGASPGTLIHIGERKIDRAMISLTSYDTETVSSTEYDSISKLPLLGAEAGKTHWLNIDGLHDAELIEAVGKRFNIHPLTLEDVLHTGQRPKAEQFDVYMYIVLKMVQYDEKGNALTSEQISFVVLPGLLISFQESAADLFAEVRERISKGKGRIRRLGSDYLAYALMDAIVDHHFVVLEKFGQDVESLEEELLDSPSQHTLQRIHELRHEVIYLRKQIWPLREVINNLTKAEGGIFFEKTNLYLRDVHDHTIHLIETIESYSDILSGYVDLYVSLVGNKMNEVMKVLTNIATIFIPITFIAGVYGMNFKYIPELEWRWGYFGAWGVMALAAGVMVLYFKKKKWW